jgi:ATP-dependent RNA helicase RhlE
LSHQDKICICRDCGVEFTFTAESQADYERRGFKAPTRCTDCRKRRSPRRKAHATPTAESPQCEVVDSSFGHFGLDPRLERAIRAAGFETPTPVQHATIPLGMSGRDLIGTAQTGTGKTAAFVLPILHHLLSNPVKKPCTRALVLTPTRELAEQISDSFKLLGKFTKIRTATVYGGVGMGPQEKALRTGADVIVACPGRLLDHIERRNTDFSGLEKLVLDEADRMLDMGFLPQIRRILQHLPKQRHTMLFSATFADDLMQLAKDSLIEPQRVEIGITAPPNTVTHALYPCPQHLKTSLILRLLDDTDASSVLVFTRTKHRADRVAQQIKKAGYKTSALHSNKSQGQGQSALDDFRSGKCQILVATDIAARGIDVEGISHVINYDIPDTPDTYIHRIGRTGRAERDGDAMTLITRDDHDIVRDIEKTLGAAIERREVEDFDYAKPASVLERVETAKDQRDKLPSVAQAVILAHALPDRPAPKGALGLGRRRRLKRR